MSEHLSIKVPDSESDQSPFSVDSAFDRESNLTIHSWQVWSISGENFRAGRTDLKARGRHLATFPSFPPTMAEVRSRALRADAQYVMLEHYEGLIGEKKRRVNHDTTLYDLSPNGSGGVCDKFVGRSVSLRRASPKIPPSDRLTGYSARQ